MVDVLFVCLGNICRSPMAEAVFRDKVAKINLANQIKVDSAGTASWHIGKRPHSGTRKKLDTVAISYEGMQARQFLQADFKKFDYIIVMDEQNLQDITTMSAIQKEGITVRKLLDYLPEHPEVNVPDPYYTGNFDYTYELVDEACDNLLQEIKRKYQI